MKYLTKEWYEEAQIFHCVLTFPETEAEWKSFPLVEFTLSAADVEVSLLS